MTYRDSLMQPIGELIERQPRARLREHQRSLRELLRGMGVGVGHYLARVARDELRRQRGDKRLSPWSKAKCRRGAQPDDAQRWLPTFEVGEEI